MKKILVAVDGSSMSVPVVDAAIDVARASRGKIRLLQIVTGRVRQPPSGLLLAPVGSSAQDTVARVGGFLADLEQQIPEPYRGGVEVGTGTASEAICRIAAEHEADLVVIGAHRYGKLARVLGTTAAKVVNNIDRPVLVVRPTPRGADATLEPEGEDALCPETAAVGGAEIGCPRSLAC